MRNNALFFVMSILCLLILQGWLVKYYGVDFAELPPAITAEAGSINEGVAARAGAGGSLGVAAKIMPERQRWTRSGWVPEVFERKLSQLASARRGAILTGGNSLIDAKVQFSSAKNFVQYLPRALQVGVLSPLPELWGGKASTPAMTLARKIVGVVTALFYICLVGLIAGLFIFRKNSSFWIILVFCLLGILVYTYSYPNVGTLMRYRYGFYMLLIAFGAAVIAEQMLGWREKRRQNG